MSYAANICPICNDVDIDAGVAPDESGTSRAPCAQCSMSMPEFVVTYEPIDDHRELEESFTNLHDAMTFARFIIGTGGSACISDGFDEFEF